MRRRLDAEVVRRRLFRSRTEAGDAIRAGLVTVRGVPVTKPATLVGEHEPVESRGSPRRFVSRGGEKLEAALDRFGVDARDRGCLDAGAATGGFTDCLLRRGAVRVVALDVGYGQLAWTLRTDPRVVVIERTNVRDLTVDILPFRPDLVVADLSFISLGLAVPALAGVARPGATFVLLVKPQFEAGRADVGKGGVVRDADVWLRAIRHVADACRRCEVAPLGVMACPVPGPAGNVEFFLHAALGADERPLATEEAVAEGRGLVGAA